MHFPEYSGKIVDVKLYLSAEPPFDTQRITVGMKTRSIQMPRLLLVAVSFIALGCSQELPSQKSANSPATKTESATSKAVSSKKLELENQLLNAASNGRTQEVRKLISLGANVSQGSIYFTAHYTLTPLANAAERGHVEIVKLLLDAGSNVTDAPDHYTALMRACIGGQPEATRLLLEAGADPNQRRQFGESPLHYAAKRGDAECVKLLLKYGADVNALAPGQYTALRFAESNNHQEAVKLLLEAQTD